MNKLDKYKVAADLKKDNPEVLYSKALDLAKEVEKMYLDNCPLENAMNWAREVIKHENKNR